MSTSKVDSNMDIDNVVYRPYTVEEFKAEVLNLSPLDLLDKLYNSHTVIYYRLLDGLGQHLSSTCQLEPVKKKELLEKILPKYETSVEVMLDKNFSLFQQYFLDSILEIPRNQDIVPAHYQGLDMEITNEHLEQLDKELEQAKNDVIAQRAFQHWIKNEQTLLEKRLDIKKQYIAQFDAISALIKENNVEGLNDILLKIKGQLDQLDRRMKMRFENVVGLLEVPKSYTMDCNEYIGKYLASHHRPQ